LIRPIAIGPDRIGIATVWVQLLSQMSGYAG